MPRVAGRERCAACVSLSPPVLASRSGSASTRVCHPDSRFRIWGSPCCLLSLKQLIRKTHIITNALSGQKCSRAFGITAHGKQKQQRGEQPPGARKEEATANAHRIRQQTADQRAGEGRRKANYLVDGHEACPLVFRRQAEHQVETGQAVARPQESAQRLLR